MSKIANLPQEHKLSNKDQNLPSTSEVEAIRHLISFIEQSQRIPKWMAIAIAYDMGARNYKAMAQALDTSHRYVKNKVAEYRKKSKMQERVDAIRRRFPEIYRELCRNRLPQLALAEGRAIELYCEQPEKLIEKPTLARQIKTAAGIVSDEEPQPATVDIQEIRNLMIQVVDSAPGKVRKLPPSQKTITVGNSDSGEVED